MDLTLNFEMDTYIGWLADVYNVTFKLGGNPTKTVFDTAVSFGKVFACVSVDQFDLDFRRNQLSSWLLSVSRSQCTSRWLLFGWNLISRYW